MMGKKKADLSSLLQTFVQQPTGMQGVSQGLQGLGQIIGQQAMQKQAAEREMALQNQMAEQELANQIALARAKAQIEQQFAQEDPLKVAQANVLSQMFGGGQSSLGQTQPQNQINQTPSVPSTSQGGASLGGFGQFQGGGFRPESLNVGGFTLKRQPTQDEIRQESMNKAEGQAMAEEAKFASQQARNFKIAKEKLKLTLDVFDAATEKGSGRFGGFITAGKGTLGLNSRVKEFEGTLIETSTAIAKIAAPSAKVGPDLIGLFSQTLPRIGFFNTSTSDEALNQTATSITNAFINYAQSNPDEFPETPDFQLFRDETLNMLQEIRNKSGNNQGTENSIPNYDPNTQKLQKNTKTGEYRVVPR